MELRYRLIRFVGHANTLTFRYAFMFDRASELQPACQYNFIDTSAVNDRQQKEKLTTTGINPEQDQLATIS